eukprot:gnl/Chilomastix_cuspidata/1790.p1 GENE.gnl/Chilomastix_cuspidata/1790~~gnl/Chilomastix_cuspidata/1790.p1  ORF type:complete len:642 (+),score=299.39 gnl/Chilomastix_cuspidata/1790:955-2880(+)
MPVPVRIGRRPPHSLCAAARASTLRPRATVVATSLRAAALVAAPFGFSPNRNACSEPKRSSSTLVTRRMDLKAKESLLRSALQENVYDFNSWTSLLEIVWNSEQPFESSQELYMKFLTLYPYCFAYWNQLAELAFRTSRDAKGVERALAVFERAVSSNPFSTHQWEGYSTFVEKQVGAAILSPEFHTRVLRRAVLALLCDWNSSGLWDKYLRWVKEHEPMEQVVAAFTLALQSPHGKLPDSIASFKSYIQTQRIEVVHHFVYGDASGAAAPGDLAPAEQNKLRHTAHCKIDRIAAHSMQMREEIFQFEKGLSRPYFHPKPLSDALLDAWTRYASWYEDLVARAPPAQTVDSLNQARRFFERCLIVTCKYPEFWHRFADLVAAHTPDAGDGAPPGQAACQAAREILDRCVVHCPLDMSSHLSRIRYMLAEQRQEAFATLRRLFPSSPVPIVEAAHELRRQAQPQLAIAELARVELGAINPSERHYWVTRAAQLFIQVARDGGGGLSLDAAREKVFALLRTLWEAAPTLELARAWLLLANRLGDGAVEDAFDTVCADPQSTSPLGDAAHRELALRKREWLICNAPAVLPSGKGAVSECNALVAAIYKRWPKSVRRSCAGLQPFAAAHRGALLAAPFAAKKAPL